MGSIFQVCAELWALNLSQNDTSQSKIMKKKIRRKDGRNNYEVYIHSPILSSLFGVCAKGLSAFSQNHIRKTMELHQCLNLARTVHCIQLNNNVS